MRHSAVAILLLVTCFLKAQENYPVNQLPVFKQVTHPFMPPITSEFFFFSEDGLIWFSTAQGLTSFDGSEVTHYSSLQEANQYGLNRIFSMAEDNNHNFYIGTPIGLFLYNREARSFTELTYIFRDKSQKTNLAFDALYCSDDGLVYAGTGSNGLFIYDPFHNKMEHFNLDISKPDSWFERNLNTISSLAKHTDDNKKLWVGTFNGIYLFDMLKRTFTRRFEVINPVHYLASSPITGSDTSLTTEYYDIEKMDVADDSTIWFNCWAAGFGKYNTHTGKAKLFLNTERLKTPERNIGYIMPRFARLYPGKYLLGIYDAKTAIFDTRTETAVYFDVTASDYLTAETKFAANDRQGNSWLLQRGFLYVIVPEQLRLQSVIVPNLTKINFSNPQLRGIYYDTATYHYYGSLLSSTGILVFDSSFNLSTVIPTPIINNFYNYNSSVDHAVTKDKNGYFWTVGWENNVLRPGGKKFESLEKVFPSLGWLKKKGEFNKIITTRGGDILFKNNDGTIYHIDRPSLSVDTIRPPVMKAEGVDIKGALAWYDPQRDFIYLTSGGGVAQFSLGNKRMRVIPYLSLFGALPRNMGVCQPTLDADGKLWFMIPKYGIRIIDPETLVCTDSIKYGTRGLMQGDYTSLIGGSSHYILFRSLNGMVVYDFEKKQSFLFDHSNGLSGPDNKSFLYSNGFMIIGQTNRFEYFKLSNLDNYSSAITPYLNTIIADTTTIFIRKDPGASYTINLPYYQNTLTFSFSAPQFFFPERIEYAYELTPLDDDWHTTDYFNRKISFTKLAPGRYVFRLKAQMQGGNWNVSPVEYIIIITPAWWQTGWFKLLCIIVAVIGIIYFVQRRIHFIRKSEQQKSKYEKELLELEAKSLRAQMNPHFIFNCMNSIKSLIQQHEEEKSIVYLTTFSKLIRTLFNNADKKEISLYDEIETCKFYLQLEAMRFDAKFSYAINIDETIDLKSVQVPALIIQPFIENAIWHGIVPRNTGGHVSIDVFKKNDFIEIAVEDDGIGRETSQQNKPASGLAHQSKGINLTQSRLELNNLLQQRKAHLETIDKKDENGIAGGTRVIIKIREETV